MTFLKSHFKQICWAVHLAAWIPLIVLIIDAINGNLTFNPIQAATQRTGDTAIILLGLSLACSPISTYLGWKDAIKLRRALGLYAFMYAAIHFVIFAVIDFGLQFNFIIPEFLQKYYLWVGLPAFIILCALAATSFRWAMRRMRRNWTRLHRYVYLGAILVVLHLALVIKGDFFRLGGDVWKPVVATIIIGGLLIVRIPPVRRALLSLRHLGSHAKPRSTVPPTPTKLAEE
ncbi:MAG TPA: protein-methionine-sulfoxide reductase heme-binding subunit MsrQ [Anaerolineae bacterium]|nr:protein-methionine-sulfoxide reductase heme-binding subunit MsrQ [Anaerolineae bacterium]